MLITCITGAKNTIWRECLHLQPEMKLVGNKSEIQQRSKQTHTYIEKCLQPKKKCCCAHLLVTMIVWQL